MLAKVTSILLLLIAAGLPPAGASAAENSPDINNPVLIYLQRSAADGTVDSLLTTRVMFDPLPEYGKTSKLIVEHQALFATDSGLMVELRGEAVERVSLDMPYYAQAVPGPITVGDSIRVEFEITPRQIGMFPLSVLIYNNVELVPDKPVMVGAMGDVPFILDSEGSTFGIDSRVVTKRNSTLLGPAPDLLSQNRIFRVKSHYPQPDLRWLSLPNRPNHDPETEIFSLDVTLEPVKGQPTQRFVRCLVTPFQDFEYGIALQLSYSDQFKLTEIDSCVVGPAKADSVYEFTFRLDFVSPGMADLRINAVTPNPDFGVEGALFSNHPSVLNTDLKLGVGLDDSLSPLFITSVPLKLYFKAIKDEGIDPLSVDKRFEFVENHWQDEYDLKTIEAPGFPLVMVHRKP